ncbi:MAG: hypothetical protein ACX939_11880, partial [Hyphococcus sp.]
SDISSSYYRRCILRPTYGPLLAFRGTAAGRRKRYSAALAGKLIYQSTVFGAEGDFFLSAMLNG